MKLRFYTNISHEIRTPLTLILEAKDGQEGWDMALKTIPNIIISDILMPDIDGFEFCRRIRKDERTSHIPILLLTAPGSREHESEGLSLGADDYITKPFDLVILQTKIENILSVRQSLKQKYLGEMFLQPRNIILSSPDKILCVPLVLHFAPFVVKF